MEAVEGRQRNTWVCAATQWALLTRHPAGCLWQSVLRYLIEHKFLGLVIGPWHKIERT